MTDGATPNLPSRDFEKTARFYRAFGFVEAWRDSAWMILDRGNLRLEFFPHAGLDPVDNWFSCCLRLDDLDTFYAVCRAQGIAEALGGYPRLHAPRIEAWSGRAAALIDIDGTLLRLIQN